MASQAGTGRTRCGGGDPVSKLTQVVAAARRFAGVTLFLTSRRSQVTRSTLAIGTGTGLLFGVVMYAVDPLGLSNVATNPSLPARACL